jgi:predicted kinase
MELVVFCGLPASGKSTFYEQRFKSTHWIVSKDLLGKSNRESKQYKQLIYLLEGGKSIVVDNTNVTREDRRRLIELARKYGAIPICYVFRSEPADCLRRNEARTGRAKIPVAAFWQFRYTYEAPTWDEGWTFIILSRSSILHTAESGIK